MRSTLEAITGEYDIYSQTRPDFNTPAKIPFRVSPIPFQLSTEQRSELHNIGEEVVDYLSACDELYRTDTSIRNILNTGKPEIFLVDSPSHYLLVRPDLILTSAGFALCEIETSPFGLALAEILNRAYRQEGFETLVGNNDLPSYLRQSTPTDGTVVYTDKTKSFQGQMMFLADKVFSIDSRNWLAKHISEVAPQGSGNLYRGFYLAEYLTDPSVKLLIDSYSQKETTMLPSLTPHMEEKALLALLWDRRWQGFFQKQLGTATFNHLRAVIPPTWIVGQEKYFALGLPGNLETAVDLALLSRSKRTFVLKSSGFSHVGSWSKGVTFLQEKSREQAKEELERAVDDKSSLYVIQEFRKGEDISLVYEDDVGQHTMVARIRLTPYFSALPGCQGKLVAIKATGCEKTNYIHATSTSINTAVCE